MAATDALYKEKLEITLDGRQVFYLFVSGAMVASLVFVLGVFVGRRVEARAHGDRPAARGAHDPLAELDRLAATGNAFAFRAAIDGRDETPELQAQVAVRKQAAELAVAPASAAAAPTAAPAAVKVADGAAADPKAVAAKATVVKAVDLDVANTKPAAPAKLPAGMPKGAKFVLQVGAYLDKAQADALAAELRAGGYNPQQSEVMVEGEGLYHRVRLPGGFVDFDQAVAAKQGFEAKAKRVAWVRRL